MLAFAVWIAVVAAAVSYSPWPISFDAFDNLRPRARTLAEAPVTEPARRVAENYGNLQIDPAPELVPPPLDAGTLTPGPLAPGTITPVLPPPVAERRPPRAPISPVTSAVSASSASRGTATDTGSAAQSTDECRLAKTRAALALCSNRGLAGLDREHALIYNQSWRYADAAKRASLQRARQRMASNLNACQSDNCASGIYLAAMREVSGIMSARPVPSAAKPSFSCRGARKPGQIAVCSDPNLAALDQHQALLYKQSLSRADRAKRAQLLRAQRRLVSRRDRCASEPCAKSAYLASMKEVAEIMTRN